MHMGLTQKEQVYRLHAGSGMEDVIIKQRKPQERQVQKTRSSTFCYMRYDYNMHMRQGSGIGNAVMHDV